MFITQFNDAVFIAKLIDFIVFAALIIWVFNKYGKAALIAHQEAQNKLVADATKHRTQGEEDIAAAAGSVEQAKMDSVRMVSVGQAQAAKLMDDARAEAHEHAKRIVAHAAGELERERYRVRRILLEETVERAHDRAQELAKREIDPAKQQILVDRLVADLERSRA